MGSLEAKHSTSTKILKTFYQKDIEGICVAITKRTSKVEHVRIFWPGWCYEKVEICANAQFFHFKQPLQSVGGVNNGDLVFCEIKVGLHS